VRLRTVPCFVGLDVAKAQGDIAVRPSGERWAGPTAASGVMTLGDRLPPLHPTLRVLEAPGGRERAAPAAVATRGRRAIVRALPGHEPSRRRWRRAPAPPVPT